MTRRSIGPYGVFLLHTIGANRSQVATDPWIEHNIFPHGMLPSARQVSEASEGLFVLEDWHNFGPDYDKTLLAWFRNFDTAWPRLRAKYGDRFYRLWKCYLLTCAGAFRARQNQLWQIVFSPSGIPDGYTTVR
jgi:cyclopropane-fatty-acyl-phospholipid synthase